MRSNNWRGGARRALALALSALLVVGAAGCATNPVTGKPQLSLISRQQEIQMGRQAAADVAHSVGLVQDSALQAYVNGVGQSVARVSARPDLPWSFQVVDDPTPNAFALPGGFIFITRGLLTLMDSEAELATVLGHEVGHVAARHQVEQMSRSELVNLGLGLGAVLFPQTAQAVGGLAQTGLQLLFLKYSRDDERQADALGYRYAEAAHYNVREMPDVFLALERTSQLQGQTPLPSWAATHPAPEQRIQTIRARLASDTLPPNLRSGAADYMRHIDGLVYGQDPREGFFTGTTFYHPALRFQLTFPQGWKSENTAQAVYSQPQQKDAVLQVTLAAGTSADSAATAFFSQQGVQPGGVARHPVNGLPAVVGEFQAQTQQSGTVHGLVGFVQHDGRVFQVLGYASATRYTAYAMDFRNTINSFQNVTDPKILDRQPNRLHVVRLGAAMTLAQFNARYPSDISLDELAIINQVPAASSSLAADTYAKRVFGGH